MAGKRTKTRKKIKLNKKLVCTIGVLLLIIAVISAIIMIFKPVNVGKINKEGKAEYIERVANVTKYTDKKIVEFKNGILKICIPKKEERKELPEAKHIEIK